MTVTLWQGDCLDLMAQIPDRSVDMVMADLPYGTTACKWDSVIPFEPLWAHYRRVCKRNAAIVLTASQPFTSALVMSNPRDFRHEWIWRKNAGSNFACVKFQPMKEHESALVFAVDSPTYNPQMQERSEIGKSMILRAITTTSTKRGVYGTLSNTGCTTSGRDPVMRVPSSVQSFNRERGLHPTQKPVALMEYLIRTYTNEGATVLDNTMGSGTTGVACVNLARSFIGIERDPDYFKIASERIALAQNPVQLRIA